MRWGIEALFSHMKTRGFGITETQLKDASRIERLMLVLAVARYWAVYRDAVQGKGHNPLEKAERSLVSFFKQGLRYLLSAALSLTQDPPLYGSILKMSGAKQFSL